MANIYVRKSGSDSNDGSTPALAVLTPEYAYSIASNEDSIIIGAGIYHITSGMSGKYLTFFGDITGEYTGDAGEVILDGLNSTYDTYNTITTVIDSDFLSNTTYVKNIIFQHIKATFILKGNLDIDNCFISKCFASLFIDSSFRNISMKDLIISDSFNNATITGIRVSSHTNDATVVMDNVLIKNLHIYGSGNIRGIYFDADDNSTLSITMKNVSVENLYAEDSAVGLNTIDYQTSGTANLVLYNCNFINNELNVGINPQGGWVVYTTTYNCNSAMSVYADNWGANKTHNNLTNKANYTIPKIEPISRFSPLLGQGNTTFPSTDIEGNPRPAYGNTNCNIGVSEATSNTIQREATIKDSGDYSIKVSPCNYFKKVFQVPVEATKLRTVKVKIRIDGAWGTYLPRVSLSGQGMTLSQDTKNSTTGSFEELTVSGTPSTTGIALLTIEAHSPNTDAAFYIDTITIE